LRKLTIVFHHAGGGHRSAADALKATLSAQENPWDVTLLDIQELLDPLDLIRRTTGLRIQDTYNLILRKGWTRFTPALLVILKGTIWVYHAPIVKLLRAYWREHPTDVALSVVPHFNREIAESLLPVDGGPSRAKTPFVTLMTDLADYPPHFWIERESEYIIAGTERAREQALATGHPADHVFQTSGMVLKPKFYEKNNVDRVADRKRLGLDPDCPTGIVLFGGHGSQVMVDITRKLNEANSGVQLILICGHNQKLAAQLTKMPTSKPILVVGFAQNVEYYMALADFFIGKPGPGSISEALQFDLPVIVERNARTLPQERYNAEWVTENGYGIVVRNFKEIAPAVQRLLEPATFEKFRLKIHEYSNRVLAEVPVILEQCAEHTAAAAQSHAV
jgi:hypothetical protein